MIAFRAPAAGEIAITISWDDKAQRWSARIVQTDAIPRVLVKRFATNPEAWQWANGIVARWQEEGAHEDIAG
jgi:hypothetical protein